MTDRAPADEKSIYSHMVRGSAWGIAMRWGVRGIGLVSTMILARLLVPEDFGIVAMAGLIYGILDMFFEMGVDLYLIRTPGLSDQDWNTAWTLRVLQGLGLGGLLLAVAPLAAQYFGEPRVVAVAQWLALAAVVRSLQNIGIVKFRKELDFASDFRFGIYGRLAAFCITIPVAVILQTYWALVIGQVAGAFLESLLSYLMHPYRPRFSLARGRPLLAFAAPMILIRISRYMFESVDAIVVGGIADSARLGPYSVAASLSRMVTGEVVVPIARALFPSYATIVQDPERFRPAYLHSVSAIAILVFPLGVGLSLVAHDFVLVVLGSKWLSAIPLIKWLALYALVNAVAHSIGTGLLLVPGGERQAMMVSWVRLFIVAPAVAGGGLLWGVQAVAIAATFAAIAFVPVLICVVTRVLPVTAIQILRAVWRPAAAGALMAVVVWLVDMWDVPAALGLAADVIVGAAAYSLALAALWHMVGRPEGPEGVVFRFVADRAVQRFRR